SDIATGSFETNTADLAVTKTVSNPTPYFGDNVTYTVTLTDNGPNNATGVTVSDLLPAGLKFVSATPSQGTYDSTTGLWTVGNVTQKQVLTFQVVAQVISPNAQINTAAVASADQRDPNSSNNQASVTETPQVTDVSVTKTDNKGGSSAS